MGEALLQGPCRGIHGLVNYLYCSDVIKIHLNSRAAEIFHVFFILCIIFFIEGESL